MDYLDDGAAYVGAWVVTLKRSGVPSRAHYITGTTAATLIPLCTDTAATPIRLLGEVLSVNDPAAQRCVNCTVRRPTDTAPKALADFLGGDI